MEEIFPFYSCRSLRQVPLIAPPLLSRTPRPLDRCRRLRSCAHLSRNTPIPLPEKSPRTFPPFPVLRLASNPSPPAVFHDKLLFLDSIGIDLFDSSSSHPILAAASLCDLRASVNLLRSLGLSATEIRRACGMCPEILTASPSDLASVISFLISEAGVQDQDLRRVIFRRPRLLVSDVAGHLRPALYFLQMLGIAPIARHTSLLSCSVEEKFLPKLEFLEGVGFSPRNARAMARRFPQLFCYSIDENLRPKVEFLVSEMQRELRELRDFPQFFSFSLPNRIKPRHRTCKEKGVVFPLPVLLRPNNGQFMAQLEVRISSSLPLKRSPLWHISMDGGL